MELAYIGAMWLGLACFSTGLVMSGCLGSPAEPTSNAVEHLEAISAATPAPCTDPPAGIHVAPSGNDGANGSQAAPLRTIGKALDRAQPGDVVVVHAGTYGELVAFPRSGIAGKPIMLRARCGERPIIDGTGKGGGIATPALVAIMDRAFVGVEGFKLTKLTGTGANFPAGIWVRGASHDVVIRNNVIDAVKAEGGGADQGAHGIGIYGTSTQPLENIVVEGNELSNLVLGASEALVLNGNVRKFTVRANHVHHSNNIAFDFIGYEGTCSGCRGDDLDRASVDRVRDGLVVGNDAHDISSRGNPAYGNDRSAGCYYVDGGGRITIERNIAHDCDLGVELASEHAGKSTSEIVVRNNFLWRNFVTGIATGGYSSGSGAGGGSAERCTIVHNTIFDSARDSWAQTGILLQNRNIANVYANNLIVATSGTATFKVDGASNRDNQIHHNLYAGGAVEGAAAGAGSITQAPQLVAPATGDLHLNAGSPAIGAGAALGAAVAGDLDFDGQPRGIDIGADQR